MPIIDFLDKLLRGSFSKKDNEKSVPTSAYRKQFQNICKIWNSTSYKDFGIERVFRLLLACLQLIFPGMLMRFLFGKSYIRRKSAVDFYVVLKLGFYIWLIYKDEKELWVIVVCSYLLSETVIYLFNLLFLNDIYTKPASYKRNLLLTLINFIEISMGFACIYNCMPCMFKDMKSVTDAVYFSFVNATSLGFGDISPIDASSKFVCSIQNIISFIYTIVILSFCVGNAKEYGFLNKKKESNKKLNRQKDT